jgi:NDP-sugar pyrophosphorylase family protein
VLGSGGGPRHALPLLADRFFLVNGDTLTDVDLGEVTRAHERSGAAVTMALIPNPNPQQYGGVVVDDAGWVRGFASPGTPGPSYHFIGVQLAESHVFATLGDLEPASSVGGLYTAMLGATPPQIGAYISAAAFRDIGTPADYLRTSLEVAGADGLEALPAGARTAVSPSASVIRTALWDDVIVEDGAELIECIVADGVRIPSGLHLEAKAVVQAPDVELRSGEERIGDLVVAPLARREKS